MAADSTTIVPSKQQTGLLERGFKAWCENTSAAIRKKIEIEASDPLPSQKLADYLGVEVIELNEVTHLEQASKDYLGSRLAPNGLL